MGSLVGLDANIFVYTLEGNVSFGGAASQVLKAITQGNIAATASELIYLEVLAGKDVKTKVENNRVSTFLGGLGIDYCRIDRNILVAAATLRREYGMRTPDAIHVASALSAGADYFVTNDHVLLQSRVPGIKLVALNNIKEAILFPRDINRLAS